MDREAWQPTVHRVTKSQSCPKWLSAHGNLSIGSPLSKRHCSCSQIEVQGAEASQIHTEMQAVAPPQKEGSARCEKPPSPPGSWLTA